jgi:hypothetical protein
LGGREQNLGAAHRKGKRSDPRAPHEGATRDVVHGFLPERCERRHLVPPAEAAGATACQGNWEGPRRPPSFGTARKLNADFGTESSGRTQCDANSDAKFRLAAEQLLANP